MTGGAKVSSIEALESFRSSLVLYLTRSRGVLEDVAQEIVRARIWLQTDRQVHWKRQIRLCAAAASQAEQELVTARLSGDTGVILDRRKALAKARDALQQAEDGLARVRRWLQRFPTDVEARGVLPHRLQHVLASEGSRAVSFLETAATILTDYAGRTTGSAAAAAEPAVVGGASVPTSADREPSPPPESASARRESPPSPDSVGTGPPSPGFGGTGPPLPGFGRTGPRSPGFGRTGPPSPDFGGTGPRSPGFGVTGPPSPGFGVTGPPSPGPGTEPVPGGAS